MRCQTSSGASRTVPVDRVSWDKDSSFRNTASWSRGRFSSFGKAELGTRVEGYFLRIGEDLSLAL